MTKRERKEKMYKISGDLQKKYPEIFPELGQAIALSDIDAGKPVPNEVIEKVISVGRNADIWGNDARYWGNLSTRNSETNYNSLAHILGEELMTELYKYNVSWGLWAALMDGFCRSHF